MSKNETTASNYEYINWNVIEQELNKFEQNVMTCLTKLGTDEDYIYLNKYKVLGEKIYLNIRLKLEELTNNKHNKQKYKYNLVDKNNQLNNYENETKQNNHKTKNKKNKKEEIIMIQTMKKVESEFNNILKYLNVDLDTRNVSSKLLLDQIFNSSIIEFKGIGLIYAAWYVMTFNNIFESKTNFSEVLNVIVSIQRYLNVCRNLIGIDPYNNQSPISQTLINDLDSWFDKLVNKYPYNGFIVYDYSPELLSYSKFNKAIPESEIKPRSHQIEIIQTIKQNMDNGFLLSYNPMIGSGKTSIIVSVISYLNKLATQNHKYINTELLFVCNISSVKEQVAKYCYNCDMGFGIGVINNKTNHYKISTGYGSSVRRAIICNPDVAIKILQDNQDKPDKFILFLDELTLGSDNINSTVLKENMTLLSIMPSRSILSSATFRPELVSNIIENFKIKNPNSHIQTIYSDEIQIGCALKTYEGELIVPHNNKKSQYELINTINTIKITPFLGRLYTPHVMRNMINKMKENNIMNVPDTSKLFFNIDNMNSDKVRRISMRLLSEISIHDDDIVKILCESNNLVNLESVDYTKLVTTDAYKFDKPTLIVSNNPIEFVQLYFKELVKDVYNSVTDYNTNTKYRSTMDAIQIYMRDLEQYEKEKLRIEKFSKKEDKISSLIKLEENKPILKFPDFGHINSEEHFLKYYNLESSRPYNFIPKIPLELESLPLSEIDTTDYILTLLFCGVGIYMNKHRELNSTYLSIVRKLASEGKLSFVIGDESICYGTNYPFNKVIITDEFAHNHSTNTLFQLMGRAGRVGSSWTAECYISNKSSDKIINYVSYDDVKNILNNNKNDYLLEAYNMITVFEQILKEKEEQDEEKLNRIINKYMNNTKSETKTKLEVVTNNKLNYDIKIETKFKNEEDKRHEYKSKFDDMNSRNKQINKQVVPKYIPPHLRK